MSIHTGTTNWALRHGYRTLAFWAPGTGEAIVTRRCRIPPPADLAEYATSGTGAPLEVAGGYTWEPVIFDGRTLGWLQQQAAAGEEVHALAVARGRGPHLRWEEDQTLLWRRAGGGDGTLAGIAPYFETRAARSASVPPAVTESPDLLQPLAFASGGDWVIENGAGGSWGTATDSTTGLSVPQRTLNPSSGTETIHAQAVVPGATGLTVLFDAVMSDQAQIAVTALSYADRNATQADILSAAVTPLLRVTETDAPVEMTLPAGTWVVRASVEVSSGPVSVRSPRLLTRLVSGAAL